MNIYSRFLFFCAAFLALETHLNAVDEKMDMLFDFVGSESAEAWASVNDGVMGGLSKGSAEIGHDGMRFKGDLSLENNGGFSSIYKAVDLDLSDYNGLRLRVKGDGRTYQLRFRTDARWEDWRAVAFSHKFETEAGEWTEVFVPFSDLRQSWRGRELSGFEFDPEKIERISIMLADKNPGPFELTVAWIVAD